MPPFLHGKKTVSERANILREARDLRETRRHELNASICLKTSKTLREADPEVSEAIAFYRYSADKMERLQNGYDVKPDVDSFIKVISFFYYGTGGRSPDY